MSSRKGVETQLRLETRQLLILPKRLVGVSPHETIRMVANERAIRSGAPMRDVCRLMENTNNAKLSRNRIGDPIGAGLDPSFAGGSQMRIGSRGGKPGRRPALDLLFGFGKRAFEIADSLDPVQRVIMAKQGIHLPLGLCRIADAWGGHSAYALPGRGLPRFHSGDALTQLAMNRLAVHKAPGCDVRPTAL